MSFEPATQLEVFYAPTDQRRERVGRLGRRGAEILFEYDAAFIARGLQLSPFKLPLRPGVAVGDPNIFEGLFGVFDDSLPDGWGRLLVDRRAVKLGLLPGQLGPLDRLSLVGARAMGALEYVPAVKLEAPELLDLRKLAVEVEDVREGATRQELERLLAIGGSPQGARPKALVQVSADGRVVTTEARPRPGFVSCMVKFRAPDDDPHAGLLELAYLDMARDSGIEVAEARMVGATGQSPGYLCVHRFDRESGERVHLHSFAGLMHASHRLPVVTYRELLLTTRELTRDESAVAEMFRRACFNVFAHNRDDHPRNFAFLMNERGVWRPSPAYDLTFSAGPGGEHSMAVGTEGRAPGDPHLLELARTCEVKNPAPIIEEVRSAVHAFRVHAASADVPKRLTDAVAKRIGAPRARSPKRRAPKR